MQWLINTGLLKAISRRLVTQTNISSNLQANSEQVRPAPDKYNTNYCIEVINLQSQQ